jgi:YHS domain-containing protein/uncharacterized membrane protein
VSASSDLVLFFGRFHPLLVHLPIGLLILLAFMEALACWRRFEKANAGAGIVLALAIPGALFSVICGWLLSTSGGYDAQLLDRHFWTGIATAAGAVLAGFFYALNARPLYRVTVFATFGIMVVASHFGGSLTHGSDYLTRYAPEPIRSWLGTPRPTPVPANPAQPAVEPDAFTQVVHPILDQYCIACHSQEKAKGSLRLDSYEALMKGGSSGVAVVPGNSAESELIARILLPLDDDDHMPPEGKPQPSPDDLALLRWWIDSGAAPDQPVAALKTTPRVAEILSRRLGANAPALASAPAVPAVATLARAEAVALANSLSVELGVPVTALSETESWLQCNASIGGRAFTDEHLARLAPIANNLRWLDLGGTAVTDAGLAQVASMPNLTRLYLQQTAVTDAGLPSLEGLQELNYLNLYGAPITDAGLASLRKLPRLRQVFLWQTQVTPSQASALAKALVDPGEVQQWEAEIEALQRKIRDSKVTVNLGLETPATPAAAGAINTLCPVTGKPVDPKRTSVYEGNTVAFCCADCKASFDKDPKPYLARLELPAPAAGEAAKPINADCPVSGKPVDLAHTAVHDGKVIGFCCADCKATFEKDPGPFLSKLGHASTGEPNAK